MSNKEFNHYLHAHCESGVTSNLLRHEGIDISEPMAFGIGAGLFFGHMPMLKVNGIPGTTYRIWPGAIFKRVAKRLNVKIHSERFSDQEKAMQALDDVLATGKPVGILGSVFYLPYMPDAFRFHFNAHNFVVYGKKDGLYQVSDPIMEHVTTIAPEDLVKCRFAKGIPEPKGFMYYVTGVSPNPDMAKAIEQGIKQMCFYMLTPPFPWFGNNAIPLLAKEIRSYPKKLEPRKAALYLGNVIRMQEEIGTGGGGFRYIYAAFLQEAGQLLKRDELLAYSEELTKIGDAWRNFAYSAARIMKARTSDLVSYDELGEQLIRIGTDEKELFRKMRKMKW
jgi:hypothetical protein